MDTISNYYENLVFEHITRISNARNLNLDDNAIQDIACIALNQLPPRYVRHRIDTIFYIQDEERAQIDSDVENAVSHAINKVADNPR